MSEVIQTLKQLIDSAVPVNQSLEDKDRMTARLDMYYEKYNGRSFTVHPTDEVKEEEEKKSILIRSGDGDGDWEIPHKGFLLVKPTDVSKVELRCALKETVIHISVFPG